jgi:hypothetical protein
MMIAVGALISAPFDPQDIDRLEARAAHQLVSDPHHNPYLSGC